VTLPEEFEQDVKVVVETLEKCAEIIEQQLIRKDVAPGLQNINLQKGAGSTVGSAINHYLKVSCSTESPVREFRRILKFLARYAPQANPAEIEKRYIYIVKDPLRITQTLNGPKLCDELLNKKEEIIKLAEDIRYYAKIVREEFSPKEVPKIDGFHPKRPSE